MESQLPLPISPRDFLQRVVGPAMTLLPAPMDSPAARVMIVAICLQETDLAHRFQVVAGNPKAKGPARGLPQFEKGGACTGVLNHDASRYWMHVVCGIRGVPPTPAALWAAMEGDDILAVCASRLLLFTDPKRLPGIGDEQGAWDLYALRTWKPGKPHRDKWAGCYSKAVEVVTKP